MVKQSLSWYLPGPTWFFARPECISILGELSFSVFSIKKQYTAAICVPIALDLSRDGGYDLVLVLYSNFMDGVRGLASLLLQVFY